MVERADDKRVGAGRDIGRMFAGQAARTQREADDGDDDAWVSDGDDLTMTMTMTRDCPICGASMPVFAEKAHQIFHSVPD